MRNLSGINFSILGLICFVELSVSMIQPPAPLESNEYKNQSYGKEILHRSKRKMSHYSSWKNSWVPYHIGGTLTRKSEWVNSILQAVNEWQTKTCVRFTRYNSVRSDIKGFLKITNQGGGCYAGGIVNLGSPYPDPSCKHISTVIHELGHWIGLSHEQKRPDSPAFVKFNRGLIGDNDFAQFQRTTVKRCRTLVPYDMNSIMHYDRTAFRTRYPGFTIDANDPNMNYAINGAKLTFYDLKIVNMVYNCSDSCGMRRYTACDNEGYMDKSCKCVCPDYLTASSGCKSLSNSGCGGVLVLNPSKPLTVTSPNYPSNYINKKTCVWVIKSPPGTNVIAQFVDFDLEDDPKTNHCEDQLEVRHYGLAHLGKRLCGNKRPSNIRSLYNNMMLIFKTDPAVTKRGFKIILHARRREDCDSSPCYNGGVCRMAELMYFCLCHSGWSGRQCERKYDGTFRYVKKPGNSSPKCPSGLTEQPLGMKNGFIRDGQITASSYKPGCPPSHARLEKLSPILKGGPCHAWCPAGFRLGESPNYKHWIMVDLQKPTTVTKIIHQPRGGYNPNPQQIYRFKIEFSDDKRSWKTYGGKDYSLSGPLVDTHNSFWVTSRITPVTARYIRLKIMGFPERVVKFYNAELYPCMRFELYGCAKPGTVEPPLPTLPPLPTTPKPTRHLATGCAAKYMTLTCVSGQTIRLTSVGWGRPHLQSLRQKCNLDSRSCPFQGVVGTRLEGLKSRCNGKQTCRIHAYYTELGDPCPGIGKMALVEYYCHGIPTGGIPVTNAPKTKPPVTNPPLPTVTATSVPSTEHELLVCTAQHGTLSCPYGQTIVLGMVAWGRPAAPSQLRTRCNLDNRHCPFLAVTGDKKNRLLKRCNGKQSCKIHAYYTELGDPCAGVGKLAWIFYKCRAGPQIPASQCLDKHDKRQCSVWAKNGECDKNPGWMKPNCRHSCGECIPVSHDTTTTCLDKNRHCSSWAVKGECKKNPTYMLVNCRKACGECGTCADENENCPGWAKTGECDKKPHYMRVHCQRSCGMCAGKLSAASDPVFQDNKCDDDAVHCQSWAKSGHCTNNPEYMSVACGKSCGNCDCRDKNDSCAKWSRDGECAKNQWMHINCRKACHLCCEDEDDDLCCIDRDPRCSKWAANSAGCTKAESPRDLQELCPYSCKQC